MKQILVVIATVTLIHTADAQLIKSYGIKAGAVLAGQDWSILLPLHSPALTLPIKCAGELTSDALLSGWTIRPSVSSRKSITPSEDVRTRSSSLPLQAQK